MGTFSLDAANPKGCTRCFCFGATERCQSSTHTRQEVGQGRWEGTCCAMTHGVWNVGRGPVLSGALTECPHVSHSLWTWRAGR